MGRLREFRRKLDEIQRRQAAGGAPRGVEEASSRRPPRWSPRLAELVRRASELPQPPLPAAPPEPVALEQACPGTLTEVAGAGRAWVMTGTDPAWSGRSRALREALRTPGSPARARMERNTGIERITSEDLLLLDIETTGLGTTPLFLIGTVTLEAGGLEVRQYLARDYAEERAALDLFAEALRGRRLLVSFNGKSFDLPYIRVRLSYHRAPALPELPHFDLLHEARRAWRPVVPNCRLKTLETAICGRTRQGDIDGADIPEAYHRFVKGGDARELAVIVEHNRLDLLTMAELLLRLPPPAAEESWTSRPSSGS